MQRYTVNIYNDVEAPLSVTAASLKQRCTRLNRALTAQSINEAKSHIPQVSRKGDRPERKLDEEVLLKLLERIPDQTVITVIIMTLAVGSKTALAKAQELKLEGANLIHHSRATDGAGNVSVASETQLTISRIFSMIPLTVATIISMDGIAYNPIITIPGLPKFLSFREAKVFSMSPKMRVLHRSYCRCLDAQLRKPHFDVEAYNKRIGSSGISVLTELGVRDPPGEVLEVYPQGNFKDKVRGTYYLTKDGALKNTAPVPRSRNKANSALVNTEELNQIPEEEAQVIEEVKEEEEAEAAESTAEDEVESNHGEDGFMTAVNDATVTRIEPDLKIEPIPQRTSVRGGAPKSDNKGSVRRSALAQGTSFIGK